MSKVNLFMGRFVVRTANPWRLAWNVLVAFLLVYTATILPYRLCFIEFAIPETIPTTHGWLIVEWVIDGLFWLDLIVAFFFSYTDSADKEVTDWYMIVRRYLKGYFILNLIACLPTEAMAPVTQAIVTAFSGQVSEDSNVHKGVRLVRLQRMSRLARLMRLGRLSKLIEFMTENPVWQEIQGIRGVRVINLFFGLLYAVHIVACGWYLTAALHSNFEESWVARRPVTAAGELSLLSEGPGMKWAHSMYFVLTVFTTVGFGDMSALTTGEIVYCCFTMLLGAVVQSIILSEVINIITSADQIAKQVQEQKTLVQEFSQHARLTPRIATQLSRWASYAHTATRTFDQDRMKEVLLSSALPRKLAKQLPGSLYEGRLMQNMFFKVLEGDNLSIPPHLPLLIILASKRQLYSDKEVVHFGLESTWNLHLVISGTFVHLAKPADAFNFTPRLSALRTSLARMLEVTATEEPSAMSTLDAGDTDSSLYLAPYQSFSHGNYFGEAEIFLSQTNSCASRRSAIRCESAGETLLLHKKDITCLVADFPLSAEAWYYAAARREHHRQRLLQNLKMHHSVEDLAISIIQRNVRERLLRKFARPAGAISSIGSTVSIAAEIIAAPSSVLSAPSPGFQRSFCEQVPHYADKLHHKVDRLGNDVRSEVHQLRCEVSELKTCMLSIAQALQVPAKTKI